LAKLLKIAEPEKIRDAADAYFTTNGDARFVRRLGVILLVCDGQPIGRAAPGPPPDGLKPGFNG
jgi:hypothetical protein